MPLYHPRKGMEWTMYNLVSIEMDSLTGMGVVPELAEGTTKKSPTLRQGILKLLFPVAKGLILYAADGVTRSPFVCI